MNRDWTDKLGGWGQKMPDEGTWQGGPGKIRERWGEVGDQDLELDRSGE